MGTWACPYCGGAEGGCERCDHTGRKYLAIVEGADGSSTFVYGSGGLTDEEREAWRRIVDEAVALAPTEGPAHDVEAQA